MKTLVAFAAILGLVGLGFVLADDHTPAGWVGKVVSVDANGGTLVVQPMRAAGGLDPNISVTVATDGATQIQLSHNATPLANLTTGMVVTVRPVTGTATLVDASPVQVATTAPAPHSTTTPAPAAHAAPAPAPTPPTPTPTHGTGRTHHTTPPTH